MKRTNLVLDEDLLNEATRVLGLKTYSATVNRALAEAIRVRKIQGLQTFFGSGLWAGDLAEMREDHGLRKNRKKRREGPN
jgi:Arc/MetJ family transcription regulator